MTAASAHKFGIVCAFAGVLAFAGCATKNVIVPPPPLADRIPAQLLACRERPVAGELTRQSDVAKYVVELDAAGEDCRRKLNGIRGLVQRDAARTGGEHD
ncbi:hypothetical protein SAMN06297251_10432 [Fulvimarina manganoxydans]|uniref:Lipoprotein n=1 Tax=Fulvimarina manganoxydans TaxID=937218 RepID=A0A1W2A9R0_9HYPH|nr:hypothetical protein [Fulvimarina manganoxydans]SMC56988.1 hypothetical protein SAMN06297251_10432 [Fulvimarina manganoxydans]